MATAAQLISRAGARGGDPECVRDPARRRRGVVLPGHYGGRVQDEAEPTAAAGRAGAQQEQLPPGAAVAVGRAAHCCDSQERSQECLTQGHFCS